MAFQDFSRIPAELWILELLLERGSKTFYFSLPAEPPGKPKLSTSQRSLDHPEDQELLAFIYLHIISGFWFNPCVFNTFYSPDIMRGTETKIFYRDIVLHTWCSVQSLSRVPLFAPPWIAAHQASLSITNSLSLLKLMSIKSVMPSSHLILCRPLLLLSPIPPSIRVFSNESTLHQVAKVLDFQLQHQSFQWTPRTDLLQDGLVGSPCSPRDSQESPPTQFKSISSSALSFLHFILGWCKSRGFWPWILNHYN